MKYHYVYQIDNITEGKSYIGVRSSYRKPIEDIGIYYFSCSQDEAFMIRQKTHPDEFRYSVLSEHSSRESAVQEEIRLHNYYQVETNDLFYNRRSQTHGGFDNHGRQFWHNIETGEVKAIPIDQTSDETWVKGFPPETSGVKDKRWIHNPITHEERYIDKKHEVPNDWEYGRASNTLKGKVCAFDPDTDEHRYFNNMSEIPIGWKHGNSKAKQSGYTLYYNPDLDKQIYVWAGDEPPEGYQKGIRPREKAPNKGKIQYHSKNLGKVIHLKEGETPPPGFTKGGLGLMKGTKKIRNTMTGEIRQINKNDPLPDKNWVEGEGTKRVKGKKKYVNIKSRRIEYHEEGTQPNDRVPFKGFRRCNTQTLDEAIDEYLSKS